MNTYRSIRRLVVASDENLTPHQVNRIARQIYAYVEQQGNDEALTPDLVADMVDVVRRQWRATT